MNENAESDRIEKIPERVNNAYMDNVSVYGSWYALRRVGRKPAKSINEIKITDNNG